MGNKSSSSLSSAIIATKPHKAKEPLGISVVCISDTHGAHSNIADLPEGDILIHGGDFTLHGKEEDAISVNEWFGTLRERYQHILIVRRALLFSISTSLFP